MPGIKMKIIVSTDKGGLNDLVYPIFGKSPTFTVLKIEKRKVKSSRILKNPAVFSGRKGGVILAQVLVDLKADAVITGNCGARAYKVLYDAGIKVYVGTGKVKDAVAALLKKKLPEITTIGKTGTYGRGRRGVGPRLPSRYKPDISRPPPAGSYR